ncbi:MATE family efflux transporter [Symbiobacterium thermophilum]|uniref:MATE family efflux transporter n=1 Tax=Symbiobacterium thermophilum TaxID=2734 RepID=UPI0035C786F5
MRQQVRRDLIHLAWPTALEQLLGLATQMVDMAFVGRVGAYAVAAVGVATQPLWLTFGLAGALGVGIIAVVSRLAGARDDEGVERAASTASWLGLGLALLLGAGLYFGAPWIVKVMGAPPDVYPHGVIYLQVLVPGLIGHYWFSAMSAALRAVGETRIPMLLALVANAVNVVLDWLLIFGNLGFPALGLAGAAVASSVARFTEAAGLLVVLLVRSGPVALRWRTLWRFSPDLSARIVRVAVPSAVERSASTLSLVVFAILINRLGTVAIATQQIAYVVEDLIWLVAFGLGTSCATLIGQSLGAQDPERARLAMLEGLRVGAAFTLTVAASFLLMPGVYMRIFTTDAQVIALGTMALRVAAAADIPMGLVLILSGGLQGAGDTRAAAVITLVGSWGVRLTLAYLMIDVLGWGLYGAWTAAACDWALRLALFWNRFARGRWKEMAV